MLAEVARAVFGLVRRSRSQDKHSPQRMLLPDIWLRPPKGSDAKAWARMNPVLGSESGMPPPPVNPNQHVPAGQPSGRIP